MKSFNGTTHLSRQLHDSNSLQTNKNTSQEMSCYSISVSRVLTIEHFSAGTVTKCLRYEHYLVNDILYHSENNSRLKKRKNWFADLNDGTLRQVLQLATFESVNWNGSNGKQCCVVIREVWAIAVQRLFKKNLFI